MLCAALAAGTAAGAGPAATERPAGARTAVGVTDETLVVDGRARRFRLVRPRPGRLPVVLVLHGGGSDAAEAASLTGFDEVARERGVLAVYPEGIDGHWSAGRCCPASRGRSTDDVRFLRRLITELQRVRGARAGRVVVAGFSEGGFMAYRLACDAADRVRAIAAVAASSVVRSCRRRGRAVSVLHLAGDRDRRVPLAGGRSLGVDLPSLGDLMRTWRQRNRCRGWVTRSPSPGVRETTTAGCADGARVTRVVHEGVGHDWPRAAERRIGDVLLGGAG